MNMPIYRYKYHIPDEGMLLSSFFKPEETIPPEVQEMDNKEMEIIKSEQEYVSNYVAQKMKQKLTVVKVSAVVCGASLGILAAMLYVSLSPITSPAIIDMIAYGSMFIGSIVGYFIGRAMEAAGASTRLAIYQGRISEKRINRLTEKLEILKKIELDDKYKETLNKAKESVEKTLKDKQGYNRFFELLGIGR